MTGPRNNDTPGVKNTAHKMVSKYHSLLTEPKARWKNTDSSQVWTQKVQSEKPCVGK